MNSFKFVLRGINMKNVIEVFVLVLKGFIDNFEL